MRTNDAFLNELNEIENGMSVCYGCPRGDELPQVAGVEDILLDVCTEMLNVPRQSASAYLHHQYEEEFEGFGTELIH